MQHDSWVRPSHDLNSEVESQKKSIGFNPIIQNGSIYDKLIIFHFFIRGYGEMAQKVIEGRQ